MKTRNRVVAAMLAGVAGPLLAHSGAPVDHGVGQVAQVTQLAQATQPEQAARAAQLDADLAQGEVRKIDHANRKLTIRHGEIRQLDMPPMTMVFQATDPKLLDGLKVGDKVMFAAARSGTAYTVTRIEVIR